MAIENSPSDTAADAPSDDAVPKPAKALPFTLAGKIFAPGEAGSVEVQIGHMIDYQPVTMTVHVTHSKRPGPVLLVSAALHGDEINGVEVVRRLLRTRLLKSLRGTLVAVPVVNMPAFLSRSRYLPDRRDLNRLFPGSASGSLGARLAHFFNREVLAHCTHAIDMHTGAVNRPNLPQIRVSPGDDVGMEMANAFHPPVIIETGLREGSFRATARGHGIPSILYEAGQAYSIDRASVRYGLRGVTSVMRYLGMLPAERLKKIKRRTVTSRFTGWVRAPRGGIFTPHVELGSAVTPQTVLGIVGDPFGKHETKVMGRHDGVVIGQTMEATVDEGDGLFHIALTKDPGQAELHITKSSEVMEEMSAPYLDDDLG